MKEPEWKLTSILCSSDGYCLSRHGHDQGQGCEGEDEAMELRHPCPRGCGRSYSHKSNLQRHLREECGRLPQFACPVCSRRFKRKDALKQHTILQHNFSLENNQIQSSHEILDSSAFC
ncbi:unnamed protein product [Bemisia tabaci]|uniref:C2H2-type domain-containing protein n=1 Tax=Bemisia tabaci TaxID=7038 RepID=A0A9P0A1E2_BEMTA|nr:unnamed protein product [Bemisia tabaci]